MFLKVVTFIPEELPEIESRLRTIFPGVSLQYEFYYPAFPTPEELWEELEPAMLERWEKLSREVQVLRLPLPQLLDTLLYEHPPTLLVVAYSQWSPRVAELVLPLLAKNYPLLLLSFS